MHVLMYVYTRACTSFAQFLFPPSGKEDERKQGMESAGGLIAGVVQHIRELPFLTNSTVDEVSGRAID